jgi:hypothetical protein
MNRTEVIRADPYCAHSPAAVLKTRQSCTTGPYDFAKRQVVS